MKIFVNTTPKRVESVVANNVGMTISVGEALFSATRTAMMDVGMICNDVAFKTKSIADEYSAFSVLSSRLAALIPYGVATPDIPKRLTERFMLIARKDSSSSVLKRCLARGFTSLETFSAIPLSSQTRIKPIHTE